MISKKVSGSIFFAYTVKTLFFDAFFLTSSSRKSLHRLYFFLTFFFYLFFKNSLKDLDTSILNKILKAAIFNQQPAMSGRFRPKLRYAHSGGKNPPRIVIHGNNLKQLQDSYTRYLENFFRRELNLGSTPLEITYKEQSNPYKSKPNLLNERQKKKRKRIIKRRKK